ncbi:MAG: pyruvate dehydrogenase E2 component (dihydrolipoamide acetyltransferase) [Phycisphaerales bacterium]|jgi:pyruvate dehydrogenase E2 component (dihydrolipoamide acetyltransferase)
MAHAKSTDPNVFILPDLGEGLEEAELVSWKVSEGDSIEEHEILAEMETDKALVEVPSPRTGVIATLHGGDGDIIKVGAPLVTYVSESGSESSAKPAAKPAKGKGKKTATPQPEAVAETEDAGTVVGKVSADAAGMTAADGKALATPAVRRLARDLGVNIDAVAGTGIGGRVTKKDVEAANQSGSATGSAGRSAPAARPAQTRRPMPTQPNQPPHQQPTQQAPQQAPMQQPMQPMPQMGMQPQMGMPGMQMMMVPMMVPMGGFGGMGGGGVPMAPGFIPFQSGKPVPAPAQGSNAQPGMESRIAFRGVRRMIAGRLRESVNTAVHFTVVDEADVTNLDGLRRQLAQTSGEKVSFLPFVCAAVSRALADRFGALNATVDDEREEIVQHGSVHLGIATDTDSGLMVPVVRDADQMGVLELGRQISAVAASARDRSIPREGLMGSTFTISNVGSHAGRFATPVINYPEVGILAIGKVYDGVVVRDGQAVVGKVMPLSLACDHRVVDGATAALMLAEVVQTLAQSPESLIG